MQLSLYIGLQVIELSSIDLRVIEQLSIDVVLPELGLSRNIGF